MRSFQGRSVINDVVDASFDSSLKTISDVTTTLAMIVPFVVNAATSGVRSNRPENLFRGENDVVG
jgi:hypothetical protein